MIYLIESAAFKEVEGNREYFSILKIGYTGDDEKTFSTRFNTYRLHNPGCKVLYTIPGLTDKDEKRLHRKFRKYKYLDYGNEWFSYESEILEFFDRYSNLSFEEIRSELDDTFKEDREDFIHSNRSVIKLILARVLTSEECKGNTGVDNILEDAYKFSAGDFSSLLEYIKKRYGEEVIKEYEERMRVLESDLESKRIVEEYYECTTLVGRLKVLCENEINDTILSNIPDNDELKSLYKVVGPEKIKSTGYDITDIRKEFKKLTFSDINLYIDIYSSDILVIGARVERSLISLELEKIYQLRNFSKFPRATDILNYFEVKEVLVPVIDDNGKKKRIKGYEILDYKKDSKAYIAYQNYLSNQEALQNLIEQENKNNI